jgi:hypothetical protein
MTIENGSQRLLEVRYRHFALIASNDRRLAALPPFEINETETIPASRLGFIPGAYPYALDGFAVAPYLHAYYPTLTPFDGPFLYDPYYYGTYYPHWVRVALPTADMLRRALPEGVLRPGGHANGFVYFENVEGAARATLTFDLVDAATGASFGAIRIPFVAAD